MNPPFAPRVRFLVAVILSALFGTLLIFVFIASERASASANNGSVSFTVITTTVGTSPAAIDVNPVTGYIYVANKGFATVSILQGTSVVTTVVTGGSPRSVAVNPANGYIYVGDYSSNDIAILHSTSVVTTVSGVVAAPTMIAVNPATDYAYVGGNYFNRIWVFSATQYITNVSLGAFGPSYHPYDIKANVFNGNVYVSTYDAGYQMKVLNGVQVIATIPVSSAGRIGVDPVTGYVYLTNANNGTQPGSLTVISGTAVVGEIPVGTNPRAIAVDPLRGYVYVANYSDGTVTVITGTSVLTTTTVSAAPYEIGVDSNTGFAFVTDELSTTVNVLQGSAIVGTATSEYGAHALASNPSTGFTYIANEYSNSVSIILRDLPIRVYLPLIVKN
jgi:DNA-binding beta-propeller fold protein YncE